MIFYDISMKKKFLTLCLLTVLFAVQQADAQQSDTPSRQVEVFCGANFVYADTNWLHLYDVQVNATPGMRWRIGKDWAVVAQGLIPVVSYGYSFENKVNKYWRLNMASVSRQLHFNEANQHLKFSVGLFGNQRYGANVKWMWPVTSWLLLQAQTGVTAHWLVGMDFKGNSDAELGKHFSLTGQVGANVYLEPWDIECRVSGGRYIANDYGTQIDVMRHFRHCTLLAYAQLRIGNKNNDIASQFEKQSYRTNGGFKVIMMLPPYKKSTRKWVVRPASNFRLLNSARSDGKSMRTYNTDPEENERELQIDVDWGLGKETEK